MPSRSTQTFHRYFPVAQRDKDWGLYVTTIGESHIAPGSPYPPTEHPEGYNFRVADGRRLHDFQLIYISAGRGWFRTSKARSMCVEAGTVMLLFPRKWHSYAPDPQAGWDEHWIGFDGSWARRLGAHEFISPSRPLLRVAGEEQMLNLFREVMLATRSSAPALQQTLAAIAARMIALVYSSYQSSLVGEHSRPSAVNEAATFLRETRDAHVDLPALAARLNVGYRWLRRAFAQHTGMSPHAFLLETRLARARALLTQSSLSIKEISALAGFEDAQYFCRIFRSKIGMPPGSWRQKHGSRGAEFPSP